MAIYTLDGTFFDGLSLTDGLFGQSDNILLDGGFGYGGNSGGDGSLLTGQAPDYLLPQQPQSAIPEPGSALMLLLGAGALAIRRRRVKRRA